MGYPWVLWCLCCRDFCGDFHFGGRIILGRRLFGSLCWSWRQGVDLQQGIGLGPSSDWPEHSFGNFSHGQELMEVTPDMVDEVLEDVHHVRWNVVERDGEVAAAGSSVCLAEENVFWRQHPSLYSSTTYSILITSGYLLYATYPASFFPLPGRKVRALKRSRKVERIGKAALHESLSQWLKSHRFFVSLLILRFDWRGVFSPKDR